MPGNPFGGSCQQGVVRTQRTAFDVEQSVQIVVCVKERTIVVVSGLGDVGEVRVSEFVITILNTDETVRWCLRYCRSEAA